MDLIWPSRLLTTFSQKQDDAEDKVDQLCELVKETLNQNDILAKRLATYESVTLIEQKAKTVQLNASYSKRIAGSLASSRQSIDEAHTQSDLDSLAVLEDDRYNDMVASGVEDSTVPTIQDNSYGFDFEGLLMDSRVYRRATLDNDDPFSVFSTAECTGTWSKLSGISLSEISNIAVLALPLYAKDVNNWEAYQLHQPGNEPAMSGAGTSTISHTSLEISRSIGSPKQWLRPFNLGRKYGNHLQATGRRIPQIFGSPLIHSTRCAKVLIIFIDDKSNVFELGSIPLVVAKTCTHLKSQGMKLWLMNNHTLWFVLMSLGSRADDAFVTKGQHARISDLENIFCKSPKYGRNIDWTGYTIYDAASLLLRYFRSLPEPIIPQRYYQRFVQLFRRCVNSEGNKGDLRMSAPVHTMTVDKIRSYIRQLPPLNRRLLLYVLDLLAFFAGDSKERGLARAKIISIFQPALLTLETVKMDTVEQRLATEAIEAMVESHAHFLPNLCQRLLGTAESRQNLKSLGYRGLVQLNEAVKVKDMFLRPGLL